MNKIFTHNIDDPHRYGEMDPEEAKMYKILLFLEAYEIGLRYKNIGITDIMRDLEISLYERD